MSTISLNNNDLKMGQLQKGQKAKVLSVQYSGTLALRLAEMGFVPGVEVTVVHEAPFSKDPILVQVKGALIALRRKEASLVNIKVLA